MLNTGLAEWGYPDEQRLIIQSAAENILQANPDLIRGDLYEQVRNAFNERGSYTQQKALLDRFDVDLVGNTEAAIEEVLPEAETREEKQCRARFEEIIKAALQSAALIASIASDGDDDEAVWFLDEEDQVVAIDPVTTASLIISTGVAQDGNIDCDILANLILDMTTFQLENELVPVTPTFRDQLREAITEALRANDQDVTPIGYEVLLFQLDDGPTIGVRLPSNLKKERVVTLIQDYLKDQEDLEDIHEFLGVAPSSEQFQDLLDRYRDLGDPTRDCVNRVIQEGLGILDLFNRYNEPGVDDCYRLALPWMLAVFYYSGPQGQDLQVLQTRTTYYLNNNFDLFRQITEAILQTEPSQQPIYRDLVAQLYVGDQPLSPSALSRILEEIRSRSNPSPLLSSEEIFASQDRADLLP